MARNTVSICYYTHTIPIGRVSAILISFVYAIVYFISITFRDSTRGQRHRSKRKPWPFGSELMRSDLAHTPSSLPPIMTKPVTIFSTYFLSGTGPSALHALF